MTHSLIELALASFVVAVGAMIQGSIGFGLNVIGAPLLVLIDTSFIPGPALGAAFVLTVLVGLRERHDIDTSGFGWIFGARLPVSIGTAIVIASLPESTLAVSLSAVVLVAVAMSALGWRVERKPVTYAAAGAASGVMGTISSVGGPPIALLYQEARGPMVRSTMSAIFAFGTITSIVPLIAVGRFGMTELKLTLILVPGVLVGYFASRFTKNVLDRGFMRPAVLGLSALSAIAAILRYAL